MHTHTYTAPHGERKEGGRRSMRLCDPAYWFSLPQEANFTQPIGSTIFYRPCTYPWLRELTGAPDGHLTKPIYFLTPQSKAICGSVKLIPLRKSCHGICSLRSRQHSTVRSESSKKVACLHRSLESCSLAPSGAYPDSRYFSQARSSQPRPMSQSLTMIIAVGDSVGRKRR